MNMLQVILDSAFLLGQILEQIQFYLSISSNKNLQKIDYQLITLLVKICKIQLFLKLIPFI
jgi:hypothetical protein